MAGGTPPMLSNQTVLQTILEKTGKTRLNRASLRKIPVADLRDVCEAVGIEHDSLTKPEIICLLLDAGELNVGGTLQNAYAVVKPEPEDNLAPADHTAPAASRPTSGPTAGRALTRKSLKPAKPTRANPRRGNVQKNQIRRPDDNSEPIRQASTSSNVKTSDSPVRELNTAPECKLHRDAGEDHVVQTQASNVGVDHSDGVVQPSDDRRKRKVDQTRDEFEAAEVTPAGSTDPEGDQRGNQETVGGAGWQGSLHAAALDQEHGCCTSDEMVDEGPPPYSDDDAVTERQTDGVIRGPPDVPEQDYEEAGPCSEGAVSSMENASDTAEAQSGAAHDGQTSEPDNTALVGVADSDLHGDQVTEVAEVEAEADDAVDVNVRSSVSDTKLRLSDGSSLQQVGADGGAQTSSGAAAKRAKVPIVWQSEKDDHGRAAERPRRGMFEQVLRASETSLMGTQEEGRVEPYDGPRLIITLVKASYAVSRNKPGTGQPRRRVEMRKPLGRFAMSGCAGVSPMDSRGPLHMSKRSSHSHPYVKPWKRSAKFTGELLPGEKAEYAKHGHCVSIRVATPPHDFWYCPALEKRFVIDPMEWDEEYQQGVQRMESSMAAHPETWAHDWIRRNTTRPARATAIRQFMAPDRMGQKVPKATYYRHFTNLAKGVQRHLGTNVRRDLKEEAYERGCARTVGCAGGLTFDMLVALPKPVIYDVLVAFGQEPCTDAIIPRAGANELLRRLITNYCPPESFDRVVCKQGQPPKVDLGAVKVTSEPPPPPRAAERGVSRASAREASPVAEPRAVRGRGHVMAKGLEHRQTDHERPVLADGDLRQPRKRVVPMKASRGVASQARHEDRQGYSRPAGRFDEGKEAWKLDSRKWVDRGRRGESPTRRQGHLPDEGEAHESVHGRHSGVQRSSAFRAAAKRSPSPEPSSRGRSGGRATRVRSSVNKEPEPNTGLGRDSIHVHEYLPAPPHRVPDVVPAAEVRPAALETTGMPLAERAYAAQGLHDAPFAAAAVNIPASSIQDHFQAALTKAVQEVVKNMGIVPGAATGGIPSVVPPSMILNATPAAMQLEAYVPPSSMPCMAEPQARLRTAHVRLPSPHARLPSPSHPASPVHPEPAGRASPRAPHGLRHGSDSHAGMYGDDRKNTKRSRVPDDDDFADFPPPRAVVPRSAAGGSGYGRAEYAPHRERRAEGSSHEYRDGRHSGFRGVRRQHGRRASPPPANPPDTREYSPARRRPTATAWDPPFTDAHNHGRVAAGLRDHSLGDARYESRSWKGLDRSGDESKQQQAAHVRARSPLQHRPPPHDERPYSSPADLPPPPPSAAPRTLGRIREPDLTSSGREPPMRDVSTGSRSQAPPRRGEGVASAAADASAGLRRIPSYQSRRGIGDIKAPPDQRGSFQGLQPGREVPADVPVVKLRSGGSRVADRRRTAANARPGIADNEDAFAVEYNCFAIGDGFEGKENAKRTAFNSGKYTSELVRQAAGFATSQIQVFISEQGHKLPLMGPVHVLQQASNSVRSTGAAAVLLGMLNPLTGFLSIGKVGDVGYLVLRPPGPNDSSNDLKVVSVWRPYDTRDHKQHFYSTQVTASMDLATEMNAASWAHDSHSAEVRLQPSDLIIAATDGFFDVVHIFGSKGLATRQYIRELYLEGQLDPGQLAEKLLLRAWNQVQSCRNMRPEEIDTPFFAQVKRADVLGKFRYMPEDDIAVVVSYVLQA